MNTLDLLVIHIFRAGVIIFGLRIISDTAIVIATMFT